MALVGAPQIFTTGGSAVAAAVGPAATLSGTTVQVEGVDETDLVKYDGERVYAVIPKPVPSSGLTRNVLRIARTHSATAAAGSD